MPATNTTALACLMASKNDKGRWNTAGHRDRIVRVDAAALATFAHLYDEPSTPSLHARLPALHAGALNNVLAKLASHSRRLVDVGEGFFSSYMFDCVFHAMADTIPC